MDFMNAHETAEKWRISVRRVQVLCKQNKIDGVERLGSVWAIPKDAKNLWTEEPAK